MPNYLVVYYVRYEWHLFPESRPNAVFFTDKNTASDYYDDMISQYPGLAEIHQYELVDGKYMLMRKWVNK